MASAKRATFNEKHHPECISRGLRTRPPCQTLFGCTYTFPLLCLLLIRYLHFLLLVILILILSLYYFTLLDCLLKTHTAFANNSRSSHIICRYTFPYTCSNAFCVHIFCNQLSLSCGVGCTDS